MRVARGREDRREPVLVRDDPVEDLPGRELARPPGERRHPERALPVRVLLAAKGRDPRVRPRVEVRTVVGRVKDDRVVRDPELVELLEHHADGVVVVDHRVVVESLLALPLVSFLHVRAKVHMGGVPPEEERLLRGVRFIHEREGVTVHLVVDGRHARARQRAGVLDAPAGEAVDHAARSEPLAERGILRIVGQLRLLLRVQVVQVAEELVEAMVGRQELVPVAQVVLAELAALVAERLQELRDRGVRRRETELRARHPHLRETRAKRVLAGDERGASRGAALLPVVVGERQALGRQAIDVRRLVAHHSAIVRADVPEPDVVAPEHEDVGMLGHIASDRKRRAMVVPQWRAGHRAAI